MRMKTLQELCVESDFDFEINESDWYRAIITTLKQL